VLLEGRNGVGVMKLCPCVLIGEQGVFHEDVTVGSSRIYLRKIARR
jgi:hypothetical protein